MKRILVFMFCVLCYELADAQKYGTNVAYDFCAKVESWVKADKNTRYIKRREIKSLCKPGVRFSDNFTMKLAQKNLAVSNLPHYELEDFLTWVENEMMNDESFTLSYTNIEKLSKNKISIKSKKIRNWQFYTCSVSARGRDYIFGRCLIIVDNNQVANVQEARLNKDNKFEIDFDDFINEYGTVGVMYNYSKDFPVGATVNYSFEDIPFMLSVDFGINIDNDKYIYDDVSMQDVLNYKIDNNVCDPKFFLTITPQLYFNYISVGCGVGFLYLSKNINTTSYEQSESHSIKSISSQNGEMMFKPMIRPVVKGFIPIADELSLCLSAGYNYVFNYKDKNGWTFGIGLEWEL